MLHVLADGVERVSLKAGPGIDGVSAMVAFSSHHAASMAKKMLVEGTLMETDAWEQCVSEWSQVLTVMQEVKFLMCIFLALAM